MAALTRQGLAVLAAGIVLLSVAWLLYPPPSPPLYDGLQGPVEPYRYLQAPPGITTTKPPTSAGKTVQISGKQIPFVFVSTAEKPPQALIIVQQGALTVPAGTGSATISVRPVPPPTSIPGTLDGNVYQVAARGGGHSLAVAPGGQVTIELRNTGQRGSASLEQLQGGQWVKLSSTPFVNINYFVADVHSLGYFALVFPAGAAGPSYLPYILVGVIVLAVLAVAIAGIRLARSRAAS